MKNYIKSYYKNALALFCIIIFIGMFIEYKIEEKSYELIQTDTTNKVEVELNNGTIEQNFVCNVKGLQAFELEFNVGSSVENDILQVGVYKKDTQIQSWDIDLGKLKNNSIKKFKLSNNETFIKDQEYKIVLDVTSLSDNTEISLIGLSTDNASGQDIVFANGTVQNNIKVINTFYYMPNKMIIVCVCILVILGMYITLYVYRKSTREEYVLIGFLLSIGIAYFILIPTFAVPDEYGHFYRSMEIAQGNLLSSHGEDGAGISYLPQNSIPWAYYFDNPIKAYESELSYLNQFMDDSHYQECNNPNQALYSPFSYLAQAIGIIFARLFTNNVLVVFFAGRLANFISSIVMLYFAIKWIPIGKRMILLITAMPMFLQEIISYSSDAVINSITLLAVSLILAIQYNEKYLKKKYLIILWIILFIIALCKIVYLPFVLLVLLVNGKDKKYWKYKVGVLFTCVLGNLIWLFISFQYIVEINPGVNTAEQIKYVLTHIGSFIQIVANTILLHGYEWILMLVGKKLSWGTLELNGIIILPFVVILVMEVFFKTKNESVKIVSKYAKINFTSVVLTVIALIFASLYAQWTPLKHNTVEGIQGRYFIPLLLCISLIVKGINVEVEEKKLLKVYIHLFWILNVLSLCELYQYFV